MEMNITTALHILFFASIALNAVMMPLLGVIMVYGRPVVNYVKAKLRGYDLAVVLGKNGRLKVIPSLYKKLEVSGNDAWLPKNPAFFNWDGVQTCVVYDGWGIILDPRMLLAAKTLAERGIESYDELQKRVKETETVLAEMRKAEAKGDTETVEKLKRWVEEYGITRQDLIEIRALDYVSVAEIEEYFTDMYPSEIKAHIDEYVAELAREYSNPTAKVGMYVIYGIMLIVGMTVALAILKGIGIIKV